MDDFQTAESPKIGLKKMKMVSVHKIYLIIVCFLIILISVSNSNAASFQGLGDLSGGEFYSRAHAVSGDGLVVVGDSRSAAAKGGEAFRWTASGGMVSIGDLPGEPNLSRAFAVSQDGSVIVGRGRSASGAEAFRWTESGGMVGLGDLAGGSYSSWGYDVSSDGSVVVGRGISASGSEAFRWTESAGMVALGDLSGGSFSSWAYGVSADGSVLAGFGSSTSGSEAFRWTESLGIVGIGDLPGGTFSSGAFAISADGSVIVGRSRSELLWEPFYWSQSRGSQGLGSLSGGSGWAESVSADGSVVIGRSTTSLGYEAFILDQEHGMRNLKGVLENDYGLDLTDWILDYATGISDDGSVIVGYGTNPSGNREAWIAKLPEPNEMQNVLYQGDCSGFGMRIEDVNFLDPDFVIETTGARFEYVPGTLKVYQGLNPASRRLLVTIDINDNPIFIKVEDKNDHVLLRSDSLNMGIYGDSTCIFAPKVTLDVSFTGNFLPDYEGQQSGELLLIDPNGGLEIYPQRYASGYQVNTLELGKTNWIADYTFNTNQKVMMAAFPGRSFDSTRFANSNVLATCGSVGLGSGNDYGQMPSGSEVAAWAQYCDIVTLPYIGLYEKRNPGGPYVVANESEFNRFLQACDANNMKVVPYSSLFYYVRKNKFGGFEEFYNEVKNLKDNFNIGGIHIDGLTFDCGIKKIDDKIANWEMIRRLRELFGPNDIMILSDTSLGTPVSTVPNIDVYCDLALNGEEIPFQDFNDPYIKYHVKKYGISNTIAMWKRGQHPNSISGNDIIDEIIDFNGRERWLAYVPTQVPPPGGSYTWPTTPYPSYAYYLQQIGLMSAESSASSQNCLALASEDMAIAGSTDEETTDSNVITLGTLEDGRFETPVEDFTFDADSNDLSDVPFLQAKPGIVRTYTYGTDAYTKSFSHEDFLGVNCLKEYETAAPNKPDMTILMAKDTVGTCWLFKLIVDGMTLFEASSLDEIIRFSEYENMLLKLRSAAYMKGTVVTDPNGNTSEVMTTFATLPQFPCYEYVLVKWTSADQTMINWEYYHDSVGLVRDVQEKANPTGDGWSLQGFRDIPTDFNGDRDITLNDLGTLSSQWLQTIGNPNSDIAPMPDGDGTVNFLDYNLLAEQLGIEMAGY